MQMFCRSSILLLFWLFCILLPFSWKDICTPVSQWIRVNELQWLLDCSVVYLLYCHWWKNQGMAVWLLGLESWLWCSWSLVYHHGLQCWRDKVRCTCFIKYSSCWSVENWEHLDSFSDFSCFSYSITIFFPCRLFSCGTSKEGDSHLVEWNETEGAIKRSYNGFRKRSLGVVQFDTTRNRFLAAGDEFLVKFWDMDSTNILTTTDCDGGLPVSIAIYFIIWTALLKAFP
jgi:hypothetical protein